MNKILVIDDDELMLANVKNILEAANYVVLTANNGIDGIRIAKEVSPTLIICDITMPELNGYGVLKAIDNTPELLGIPFIFISSIDDFRSGMNAGADDFLSKPFNAIDLLNVVSIRIKKKTIIGEHIDTVNNTVNDAVNKITKEFRKKDIIFEEGDACNYVYFIVSGRVENHKTNERGQDCICAVYNDGDVFGYSSLLEGLNHMESSIAITDCVINMIPIKEFKVLLLKDNDLANKMIKTLSLQVLDAEERLLKMAFDSARKRVAEALLFLHYKYETELNHEFTASRDMISSLAGLAPESVSRNLTNFKEEGLIDNDRGTIKIKNIKKLEGLKS